MSDQTVENLDGEVITIPDFTAPPPAPEPSMPVGPTPEQEELGRLYRELDRTTRILRATQDHLNEMTQQFIFVKAQLGQAQEEVNRLRSIPTA